jgi:hypothetical protein
MSDTIPTGTGYSEATVTGDTFPGIAYVQAYDSVNGYVLVKLKAWNVFQPGISFDDVTYSQDQTYTYADFRKLEPLMVVTGPGILPALYDAQRNQWTYPIPTEPYKFYP